MQAVEPAHEGVRVAAQVLEVARQDFLQDGELVFADGLEDELAVRRVVEEAARLAAADQLVERRQLSLEQTVQDALGAERRQVLAQTGLPSWR